MDNHGYTQDELDMFFDYLNDLRESGETNMFGAAAYINHEFGVGKEESRNILSLWMKSFDE